MTDEHHDTDAQSNDTDAQITTDGADGRIATDRTVPVLGIDALTAICWLPVVGYAVLLPYSVVLRSILGPEAHPTLLLGVPEVLLGLSYVAALRADRRYLRDSGTEWAPHPALWYPLGFVLGATALAAPVVPILYFRRRRGKTGRPAEGWLATVRGRTEPATVDGAGQPDDGR